MYLINNLKINVNNIINNDNELTFLLNHLKKILKNSTVKDIKIIKKSLDARHKPDLFYIYSIAFNSNTSTFNKKYDINKYLNTNYEYYELNREIDDRPVIVGSGPAGLFCAYSLLQSGLKPIIIERGKRIEDRQNDVNKFWKNGTLDPESNVQFGEGGAGTFSDGKLNTAVKDKTGRIKEVLKIFIKFGADPAIEYINKPHIGTDILSKVIINIRKYLEDNGVTYMFESRLDDINIKNNKIQSITINKGLDSEKIITTNKLILAIGHSARDTFLMLKDKSIPMQNKAFAVGLRVMHDQKLIDHSQYGENNNLPAADYKLTVTVNSGRGVYSFCMCPGGYVVNASSEYGRLCVNGMSYSKRDSGTANSAIIVTIDEKDYGNNLLDGMYFQRKLEENSFNLNNGKLTIQRLIDFVNNTETKQINNAILKVKGQYELGNLRSILPDDINNDIIEAFNEFNRKIKGFDNDESLLTGIESRTSSPVKIIRNNNCESDIHGLYPCGEGAGYAGGITSAAADGLKVANWVVNSYNN